MQITLDPAIVLPGEPSTRPTVKRHNAVHNSDGFFRVYMRFRGLGRAMLGKFRHEETARRFADVCQYYLGKYRNSNGVSEQGAFNYSEGQAMSDYTLNYDIREEVDRWAAFILNKRAKCITAFERNEQLKDIVD